MKWSLQYILLASLVLTRTGQGVESKILYEEDPTLLTSTIQVVVTSGAADDPGGKNGLANLLAELVLRGTRKKSRTEFQSTIERLGASLSVRATHDLLVFEGRVIKENTLPFLKLLGEALLFPKFDPKEFESLKKETLGEIAYYKNSNARLSGLALRKELMEGTTLERPTSGSLSTVKAITRDDVIKAYNNDFSRGNVVFAVSSPLKEPEVKKALNEIWMTFPDGTRRMPRSISPSVPKKPTLIVVQKDKTSTGAIMFGQSGIIAQDPVRYALSVGNFSFGSEPLVSRLYRVIRKENGWTYAVGSTYHAMGSLSNQQGFFVISATPSVEFTAKTILKTLELWNDFLKTGVTSEELSLAKESLVNSYPFEFDSAEKRTWQKLYSFLYNVPILSPEDYGKTINAVDNKAVLAALRERHANQGWVITVVADKAEIERQLKEEQKSLPEANQLKIAKVITPDDLVIP